MADHSQLFVVRESLLRIGEIASVSVDFERVAMPFAKNLSEMRNFRPLHEVGWIRAPRITNIISAWDMRIKHY